MHTVELTIYVEDDLQDFLIAELATLDFETFVQEDTFVQAYIAAPQWTEQKRDEITQWLRNRGVFVPIDEETIEPRNWNEQWEETIRPLAVGSFIIKPTWAALPPTDGDKILLEIDPKMSFGTGYHASTRLVLRFLPQLINTGARILDAGTGTGILAIAALKLGATQAYAFDIDPWAQENAVENFHLNGVSHQVVFRTGSLEVVTETGFDVICANINLNVLLEMLPALTEKLTPSGHLVLAGLLRENRSRLLKEAATCSLIPVHEAVEDEWWSVVLTQRNH